MNPTLAVIQAINTVFRQSGPLTTAFPNWTSNGQTMFSLYQDLAPEGCPTPYLVYQAISSPSSTVYGRVAFTEPSIRFTGFAADSVSVMNAMATVVTAFDEAALPLGTGNNQLLTTRMGDPVPYLADRATDGSGREIWAAMITYQFAAQ